MRSDLIFQEGFIDTTVDGFLANYRKSILFAGLGEGEEEERQEERSDKNGSGDQNGGSLQSPEAPAANPTPTPSHAHKQFTAQSEAGAAIGARQPKGVGMRQEVFALAEGDVTIQWPERMSQDSLEDFKDWLRILERKITRSALPPEVPAARRRVELKDDEQDPETDA
jgi:hypothetical protein